MGLLVLQPSVMHGTTYTRNKGVRFFQQQLNYALTNGGFQLSILTALTLANGNRKEESHDLKVPQKKVKCVKIVLLHDFSAPCEFLAHIYSE